MEVIGYCRVGFGPNLGEFGDMLVTSDSACKMLCCALGTQCDALTAAWRIQAPDAVTGVLQCSRFIDSHT